MYNFGLREEIEELYHYLQRIIHHKELIIPSNDYDLVLDIILTEDERIQWSYYYASHETRSSFWLDVYDANHVISEVFWVTSPAHVEHQIETLYWRIFYFRTHWSTFPAVFDGRCLRPAVYDELLGILSHGCIDVLILKSSTLPYDGDTMQKMINLVRTAKVSDADVVYHTTGVTHSKFLNIHGQQHARLFRNQIVYSGRKYNERSLLVTLLSPLLFLAPEVHLQEMEKVWTDEIIIERVWRGFTTKLVGGWEELILLSTVMLSANVGFLAIPGVVISNINGDITSASQIDIFVSPAQIASSISMLASVGSIMIGMLPIYHSRPKQKEDPAGAVISHLSEPFLEFIYLYILSPSLNDRMVIFFIALLFFGFHHSKNTTRIFIAVDSAMLAALFGWFVRWAWKSSGGRVKRTIDRPAAARTVAASETPHRGEGGRGRQHEGEFVQRMDELDFVMRSLQEAIDMGYSPSESIVEKETA
ncbi:hypothetical protein EDB87DRAFT_1577599 [Lactarius vividus]|nr:hypothetical protein EDB87DRAFT_1577599 [Lactarius vividus]